MKSFVTRIAMAAVTVMVLSTTTSFLRAAPAFAADGDTSAVVVPVGDTTAADFAAGTVASVLRTDNTGGEITLAPPVNSFSSPEISPMWEAHTFIREGSAAVSNGELNVTSAAIYTVAPYSRGATVEMDAVFNNQQRLGFSTDVLPTGSSAVFANEFGNLYAYANGIRVDLSPNYLYNKHHYKVAWGTSAFIFYIDNAAVATIPWTVTSGLRPVMADDVGNGAPLVVDNVIVTSYSTSGTYTSRVLDAGAVTTWSKADWSVELPAGTNAIVSARSGNTATPNTSWSAYKAVTPGESPQLSGRYLQYRVSLTTNTFGNVPVLKDIVFVPAQSTEPTSVSDTTVAQFAAGSPGAGVLTSQVDGELAMPISGTSTAFPSSGGLPANWTSYPVAQFGTWSTTNDALRLEGATASSAATYGRGTTVEFDATLSGNGQTAGFYADATANAYFSTVDGQLVVNTNGSATAVAGNFLGAMHHYKIAVGSSSITYSVDGNVLATVASTNSAVKAIGFTSPAYGEPLIVDNVAVLPYTISYTFTSRVLDAGSSVKWNALKSTISTPAGTSAEWAVRTGVVSGSSTAWSGYKTVTLGQPLDTTSRYIQYRVTLRSAAPFVSPLVSDVTVDWAGSAAPTTVPPQTTTTVPQPTITTATQVLDASAVYGDSSVSLSADVRVGVSAVTAGAATFTVANSSGVTVGQPVVVPVANGAVSTDYALPSKTLPGSYVIKVAYAGTGSYKDSSSTGTLTVEKRKLTVTVDNASRVYGSSNPAFTATYANLLPGGLGTDVTGTLQFDTTATVTSVFGSYPVTAGGLSSSTYDITYVAGSLAVTRVQLQVSVNDASSIYGADLPQFSVRYDGFTDGDDASSLNGALTFDTFATPTSGTGKYVVDASGLSSNKYEIIFNSGTLTVNKAVATVKVVDSSKVYGSANPGFAIVADGLAAGDDVSALGTPVFATDVDSATSVGTYAVSVSGLSSDDYDFKTVDGKLAVTPAVLTARADNKAKSYGADVPGLTVTYSGFVNGDGAADIDVKAAASTSANSNSAIGVYDIELSGASDDNYTFAYSVGKLTVGQAVLTVSVDNATKTYGAANPAFTATFRGLVNGDGPASLSGAPVFTTVANRDSIVGSYTVAVSGLTSSNYVIKYVDGTLLVNRNAVTVKVNDASKTYGSTNPVFTAEITGSTKAIDSPKFFTSAKTSSGAGQYQVTASGIDETNFDVTYVPGTLTVNKADLQVAVNNATKVYGSAVPAFTAELNGFVNGDDAGSLSGNLAFSSDATAKSPVGDYLISATGLTSADYDITFTNGSLAVTPATVDVSVGDASKTYGDANPAFAIEASGLVNGDSADVLGAPVFNTDATAASSVGRYSVAVSGLASENYVIRTLDGVLNVTPAQLTVKADNKSKGYGRAVPALSATYSGFVNGDGVESLDSVVAAATDASTTSPVGSYVIRAPQVQDANYSVVASDGVLVVDNAVLTVAVDNASKVYGTSNPAFTTSITGFMSGDSIDVVSGAPTFTTDANATSGVGSYKVSAAGLSAANYSIRFVDGNLDITPADVIVQVANSSKTYGDDNPRFDTTVTGLVNSDALSGVDFTTAATKRSVVGTYVVDATASAGSNYNVTVVPGSLVVNKADLKVTAANATKTYGAAVPELSVRVDGLVNGDKLSGSGASTVADASSDAGTYVIAPTPFTTDNYNVAFVDGSLTVTPAALAVKVDNSTKVYGSNNPDFAVSATGFVNGDGLSVVGTPTFVTSANAGSNVGDYKVSASGLAAKNYTLSVTDGTLKVTPATLVIKSDDKFVTYGSKVPALTTTYTGFVNNDVVASLDKVGSVAMDFVDTSTAGSYPIPAPLAADSNYVVQSVPGTLTVGKAVLNIAVNNSTKTYGSKNPIFTSTITGFVNGDGPSVLQGTPVFTTAANDKSATGSYPVVLTGWTSNNYEIRIIPGTLSVTPATLTVGVTNASKIYGSANPAFKTTVSGLVNGDTSAVLAGTPAFNTAATSASAVGSYPVTASGLAAANYNVVFTAGTLTVTPAALAIKAADATRTYGAAQPAFTFVYDGFVNGDTAASLKTPATATSSATATSKVGTYPIVVAGATATNYVVTKVNGTLAVTPAALTIKADDQTKVAGQANPLLTTTATGFVNGEGLAALTGTMTVSTTATTTAGAGSYPITASGLSSTNYKVNFVPGTMTVTAAPPVVDNTNSEDTRGDIQNWDSLYRWFGGYSLTRQQLDCKTGALIGTDKLVQSRSTSGDLKVDFDFKDVTVGTCWTIKLKLTRVNLTLVSQPFLITSKTRK